MQLDEVDKIKAKRHAEDHINNIAPEDLGYWENSADEQSDEMYEYL
jgi:hypothetical protein